MKDQTLRRARVQRDNQEDHEMTTEEKRIKIAEACGLKTIRRDYHWRIGDHLVHGNGTIVPAYFNDLNAMHEAEKTLKSEQHFTFQVELARAINTITYPLNFALLHATAAQRAEAFGLTLNLWNPGE